MYSCVTGKRRLPAAVFVPPSTVYSFVFFRDLLIAIILLSNSISDQRSAASSPRLVPHSHAVLVRYLNCHALPVVKLLLLLMRKDVLFCNNCLTVVLLHLMLPILSTSFKF